MVALDRRAVEQGLWGQEALELALQDRRGERVRIADAEAPLGLRAARSLQK